jgi:hypothetical protein
MKSGEPTLQTCAAELYEVFMQWGKQSVYQTPENIAGRTTPMITAMARRSSPSHGSSGNCTDRLGLAGQNGLESGDQGPSLKSDPNNFEPNVRYGLAAFEFLDEVRPSDWTT